MCLLYLGYRVGFENGIIVHRVLVGIDLSVGVTAKLDSVEIIRVGV